MCDDGRMARGEIATETARRFVRRDVLGKLHADAETLVIRQDHDPRDPFATDASVQAARRAEGDGFAMVVSDPNLPASIFFSRRDAETQRSG